jgi:hypothetical protein
MALESGHNSNTTPEVVISEPTTRDMVYAEEEVNYPPAMVRSTSAWITQLFAQRQKIEEDVRILPEAREDEDVMEIDISDMWIQSRH